jgi:hypothetical protein
LVYSPKRAPVVVAKNFGRYSTKYDNSPQIRLIVDEVLHRLLLGFELEQEMKA